MPRKRNTKQAESQKRPVEARSPAGTPAQVKALEEWRKQLGQDLVDNLNASVLNQT